MTTTVPPDSHSAFDDGDSLYRTPPNDLHAERAVLGSMLIAKYAIDECADILGHSGVFYHPKHATIFEAVLGLHWEGLPADAITVADKLDRAGELGKIGGQSYLHELIASIPTAANGSYYAGIVVEKSTQRRLVEAGTRIVQLGFAGGTGSTDDLVGAAAAEVEGVTQMQATDVEAIGSYLDDVVEATWDEKTYMSTPWAPVNRIIGGFEPGRVYTFGARPGGGKSIAMEQACLWVAQKHQLPAAITSLEMPRSEFALRALALMSGVDYNKIKNPRTLSQFERQQVGEAQSTLRKLPLFIDDAPNQTVERMRTHSRQVKNRCGKLGIVGVDYAQIFDPTPGRKFGTRQEEVAHISRQTKMTAKALEVPVILLAQLNTRDGSKPTLGSLRESGSLEQDSDVVILMHRDTDEATGAPLDDLMGLVAKNRSGPQGAFNLFFDGARMRFTEHPDPIEGM